jgi:isopropylmalate/homocitrate/citramalate synthase
MRHVVSIDNVVVPVSLTGLEHGALETEGTLPGAGLGNIPGERELAIVVVPGTEKVDSLDISRSAEREIQLDGGHYCGFGGDVYI